VAKPEPIRGLEPQVPFALAAARVVAIRGRELIAHSEGVLDISNIERVHGMRVATRRLRAALEIFGPCFPRKRLKRALREVKRLADALGERRDRDVAIAALSETAAAMSRAERTGIESLIAALRTEQADANRELAPHVSKQRLESLGELIEDLVTEAEARAPAPPPPALRVVA
jgi:CHAD domain-containing protein